MDIQSSEFFNDLADQSVPLLAMVDTIIDNPETTRNDYARKIDDNTVEGLTSLITSLRFYFSFIGLRNKNTEAVNRMRKEYANVCADLKIAPEATTMEIRARVTEATRQPKIIRPYNAG